MTPLQNVIGDYEIFLRQILREVVGAGFDLKDFVQLDHMCYRTISAEKYEMKKQAISAIAQLLGEIQVNNRPIAVFRFDKPIMFEGWRIDAIELAAPKAQNEFVEGLEHVEFVIFDDKETFLKKYAHQQFELRAADRGVNPEIGFKLPSYGVKFHLLNLPTVLYLEQKLGLMKIGDH